MSVAKRLLKKFALGSKEIGIVLVTALILSALFRALFVQAFYIPSASMEQTLMVNDKIMVSKIATRIDGVRRGDVVVFTDPSDWLGVNTPTPGIRGKIESALVFVGFLPANMGEHLVKRVVGIAGDKIKCCDADGNIVVNGMSIKEPQIQAPTDQVQFEITVPPGYVFVMGDNRGNSRDSRYHLENGVNGAVPLKSVLGRVFVIIWPTESFGRVGVPDIYSEIPDPKE